MNVNGKKLVILAETDDDIGQHVSASLKLHGLEVYRTQSAEETLEQLARLGKNIDLVCMSGELATRNGGLLLSRIKDSNPAARVFVIADANAEYRSDILRYGADEYIEKPLGTDTIVTKSMALVHAEQPENAGR
jgi:DNA-binding response OmpR family regulator